MFVRQLTKKVYEQFRPYILSSQRARSRYWLACLTGYEEEWSWIHKLGPNKGLAVDIGTNEGVYAWKLALYYPQVIAFEPNPLISADLLASGHSRIKLHNIALSSSKGEAIFYVPLQGDRELSGWGSLNSDNNPGGLPVRKLAVKMATLDSYRLADVGMMKIDVEGHEVEVIRGGLNTIRESKPVILAEIGGQNLTAMDDLLLPAGYIRRSLHDCVGKKGYDFNWWYFPVQKG